MVLILGRDGIRGGTWLAVATNGRFAVVTNYQEPREPDLVEVKDGRVRAPSLVPGVKSRGDLPTNFLAYVDLCILDRRSALIVS